MKKYMVVSIYEGYQKQMTSEDGTHIYTWGEYVTRAGIQNLLNHYASKGWELFQLIPTSAYNYEVVFVRNA